VGNTGESKEPIALEGWAEPADEAVPRDKQDPATPARLARPRGGQPVTGLEVGLPLRWEYTTVVMQHPFMGWWREDVNLRALDEQLDTLGAEGWELVDVWWNKKIRGKRSGHLMLLKRPSFTEASAPSAPSSTATSPNGR
jgi:hypothetical protein